MKYEIQGVGVAVAGEEEDYLQFTDDSVGMARMVKRAGGQVVGWYDRHVLTYRHHPEYVNQQPATLPQVYRMRVVMEIEPVSAEETIAFWSARQVPYDPDEQAKLDELLEGDDADERND